MLSNNEKEVAEMKDCPLCKSRDELWFNWGNMSFRLESCGCARCEIECNGLSCLKSWNKLRRERVMLKHGHELLCDCGQRLDDQGVCISCHPPEEAEDEVLEREAHDPKPLNFDKNQERKYEPEMAPDEWTFHDQYDYDGGDEQSMLDGIGEG